MTQALYAHMNNKRKMKKKMSGEEVIKVELSNPFPLIPSTLGISKLSLNHYNQLWYLASF
jgi:hypothetical protein